MRFVFVWSAILLLATLSCSKKTEESTPPVSSMPIDRMLVSYQAPSGHAQIYSIGLDGSTPLRLTTSPGYDDWWPRLSPDRKKILFYRAPVAANESYAQAVLMMMNWDGTGETTVLSTGGNSWTIQAHAEWSPSGNELVMCGTQASVLHVFVTDLRGAIKRQLTTNGGWNCDPAWSPDGATIVFNRCVGVNCHSSFGQLDIYKMNAVDGSNLVQLTSADGTDDYDPYFSPNGSSIAWLKQTNNTSWSGIGAWAIRKANADGSGSSTLINDGNINSKPSWSLDGQKIYFHRMAPAEVVKWRLFSFNIDGSGLAEIKPFGQPTDASVGDITYPGL